ncbi:Forkhead Box Protein O1 [Manis pentadactyla]|nr:Forkhead Box Protein O1 [Manis pentadactyla]
MEVSIIMGKNKAEGSTRRPQTADSFAPCAQRRPDVGPALSSAVPSSRHECAGSTDLTPQPRITSSHLLGPGAALAPSLLSSGGRKAAIDLDLKPLPRSDVSHYSSATSSLAPWGGATRNPDAAAGLPSASVATEGQPRKSSSSGHSAWCNLSHADRIAESIEIESSAEKRLTLPQIYGGWSRAGPS